MNATDKGTTSTEVACVAITLAKAGYEDAVRKALEDLIDPVRQEEGYIQYDLHQDPKELRRFVFIERWASMAQFEAHCVAPHVLTYLKLTDGWLEYSAFYPLKKLR